jgi:hypothetical protein
VIPGTSAPQRRNDQAKRGSGASGSKREYMSERPVARTLRARKAVEDIVPGRIAIDRRVPAVQVVAHTGVGVGHVCGSSKERRSAACAEWSVAEIVPTFTSRASAMER